MALLGIGLVACGAHAPDTPRAAAPPDEPLAALGWMAGSWVREADGIRYEEHWTPATAGVMWGVNRTTKEGRVVFFEYLRIEPRAGDVIYFASPGGRCPPADFRMTALAPGRVVFERAPGDFPQTITYRRTQDTLTARIEGGGQAAEQSWRRTGPGSPGPLFRRP